MGENYLRLCSSENTTNMRGIIFHVTCFLPTYWLFDAIPGEGRGWSSFMEQESTWNFRYVSTIWINLKIFFP